ncbi:hypothetical protein GCM10029992_46880 [Glycomyces albus]
MPLNSIEPEQPPIALGRASLPDLMREQALLRPDATAVDSGPDRLTYGELTLGATELSGCLARLGVDPGDLVGLYLEPSLDLMTGVWGVLFAGGAYVPLSPEYPEDRLRYMIQDSGLRVVVTQDHLAGDLKEIAPPETAIVTVSEARGMHEPGPAGPSPRDLAYVIYTSGSTGRPKGVMIEHRSIVSQMRWLHGCGHLGEHSRILQKTPMSFDAAQWEILSPAVGARVVMGAPGIYRDPDALIDTIVEHQVTTLQCVPTLLQALVDTAGFGHCTTLRQVFSGGEALSERLAAAFFDRLPGRAWSTSTAPPNAPSTRPRSRSSPPRSIPAREACPSASRPTTPSASSWTGTSRRPTSARPENST